MGLPEYDNACAARLSYALNESGVKMIPNIKGQTREGHDGKNYFMFARDMMKWFVEVWGSPRAYVFKSSLRMMNGLVYQEGLDSHCTGHVEYFYKGLDGHGYSNNVHNGGELPNSAQGYYGNPFVTTNIWKCGM